jgi:hypothetical protein
MKANLVVLIGCALSVSAVAQTSIERSTLNSAGGYSVRDGFSLSYSLGEAFATTLVSPTIILTQGFQQPGTDSVTRVETMIVDNLTIRAYPNPTTRSLTLDVQGGEIGGGALRIEIADARGAIVDRVVMGRGDIRREIDFTRLQSGVYTLYIHGSRGSSNLRVVNLR